MTGDSRVHGLARFAVAEFDALALSEGMKRYLAIPAGSVAFLRFQPAQLARMAMIESFLRDPSWSRVWFVASHKPDAFSGLAVANYLTRVAAANFVRFRLDAVEQDGQGVEAALFAHIKDERSRPSRADPATWVGDAAGYHENAYLVCTEFLAKRNASYMAWEWSRLSTFRRNTEIAQIARNSLSALSSEDGARSFSEMVAQVASAQERFRRSNSARWSIYDIMAEKTEVRVYDCEFLGGMPAEYFAQSIIGGVVRPVDRSVLRRRGGRQKVCIEGSPKYLDRVQALLELLKTGETGEVDMPYESFLVRSGEYSQEIEAELPPYTCIVPLPEKRLLAIRVLNENREAVESLLR